MHHTNNVLIEDNRVSDTGKASIAPYQTCGNIVSHNTMSKCMNHEWDTATVEMMFASVAGQFGDDDGVLWPNYNNVVSDNTIINQQSMIGIRVGNTNFSSQQSTFRAGIATYNIRVENNVIDMEGATNGPNVIPDTGSSQFTGGVGIVAEAAYLSTLRKVMIRGNTIKNSKYGVWVGGQFEELGPNRGKLQTIWAVDNNCASCETSVYVTPGLEIERTAPAAGLGFEKPARASSFFSRDFSPDFAVDGSAFTGWSAGAGDTAPAPTLDLGALKTLHKVELVTRQDLDQPSTRQNFVVEASTEPTFLKPAQLGAQGPTGLEFRGTWTQLIAPQEFRYVRVRKTDAAYFFIAELKVE
jgi:F5/8 type C domain/Right handed beta helix region